MTAKFSFATNTSLKFFFYYIKRKKQTQYGYATQNLYKKRMDMCSKCIKSIKTTHRGGLFCVFLSRERNGKNFFLSVYDMRKRLPVKEKNSCIKR